MKPAASVAWFAVLLAVFSAAAGFTVASSAFRDGSFKAFYCAGKAVWQRRDPYRVEPLRACEREIASSPLPSGYVEPAPLPGFALAMFALLSRANIRLAAEIFAFLIVASAALIALLLSSIARAPPAAVLALLIPLSLLNLALGEIPPLATLALSAAGYGLAKKRWTLAGIAVALTLVEPHVGLPAVLAAALFVPRIRVSALWTLAVLALLSLAAIGAASNVEYVRAVLPAQAFSELVASDQYSLSHLFYVAGVPPRMALTAGELSYVFMAAAGIALGRRASAAFRAPSLALFVPSAAVLFGGVFLHDIQIVAAIPAILVLAAGLPKTWRVAGFAALVLLAVVWTQHVSRGIILVDAIAVAGAAACVFQGRRAAIGAAAGIASTLALLLLIGQVQPVVRATQVRSAAFAASASELASSAWGRYERATPALMLPRYYQQMPTWLGLVLLLGFATFAFGLRPRAKRYPMYLPAHPVEEEARTV